MSASQIRRDLLDAHERAWGRLGRAGTWLDAETRIAVAAETRHASRCRLCARRKQALSPYAVDGTHDSVGGLPAACVELIHRVATDPGRLTRTWFRAIMASGVAETEYVEIVSVLAHVIAIDTFAGALGIEARPLPAAQPGAPSHYRPAKVRHTDAWVPTLSWGDADPAEADLVSGPVSNIRRALTLVPDEARSFFDVAAHQYLSGPQMFDFSREYRAITHAQIELLAARISALNQCTYWTTRHALLLRASSQQAGENVDLGAVTAGAARDSRIAHGALLIAFAEAVLERDDARLDVARSRLREAMGPEALVDAAGVVGFFNAIDRVADATGTPLDDKTLADSAALRKHLGIDDFASAKEALEHGAETQ